MSCIPSHHKRRAGASNKSIRASLLALCLHFARFPRYRQYGAHNVAGFWPANNRAEHRRHCAHGVPERMTVIPPFSMEQGVRQRLLNLFDGVG